MWLFIREMCQRRGAISLAQIQLENFYMVRVDSERLTIRSPGVLQNSKWRLSLQAYKRHRIKAIKPDRSSSFVFSVPHKNDIIEATLLRPTARTPIDCWQRFHRQFVFGLSLDMKISNYAWNVTWIRSQSNNWVSDDQYFHVVPLMMTLVFIHLTNNIIFHSSVEAVRRLCLFPAMCATFNARY